MKGICTGLHKVLFHVFFLKKQLSYVANLCVDTFVVAKMEPLLGCDLVWPIVNGEKNFWQINLFVMFLLLPTSP